MRFRLRGEKEQVPPLDRAPAGSAPCTVRGDRYERFDLIPWFQRQVVQSAKVLVVGTGALGNEILKNLALFGVGRIVACDFDKVELSNLSRALLFSEEDIGVNKAVAAAGAINRINPHVLFAPLAVNILGEVGTAFFGAFDIVIGAVDTREGRLAINRACWKMNRPFIDGALDILSGVVKVFVPPDSPCYECTLSKEEFDLLPRRNSCGLLEREAASQGAVPTTPVSAAVIGALQVQEALKILHAGVKARRLHGEGYVFDGLHLEPMLVRFQRKSDEDCSSHDSYGPVLSHPASRRDVTVGEILDWARREHGFSCSYVAFERDILLAISCDQCGQEQKVNRPDALFRTDSESCTCGSRSRRASHRRRGFTVGELASETLIFDLGLPPMDILTLQGPDGYLRVTLVGDRRELLPTEFFSKEGE